MPLKADAKILVVDDMSTMRKIVKNMLSKLGFSNIHQADDGIPGWKMLEEAHKQGEPFDFVVSDWNMPGMTGLDLVKKIRASEEFKKLPFLMVTAEAEQANVVIAVQAGVSNFVVKPFAITTLKEKMDKIFGA